MTSSTSTTVHTGRSAELQVASRLRLAITRMARRLRQESGSDLGPSQLAALATLERHGPLTPSELAEHEGIRRPGATRILARLDEAGLVERLPDPADGRSAIVSIGDEGRSLLRRLRRRKTAYLATRIRELPESDRRTLARAAEVLEHLLESERA